MVRVKRMQNNEKILGYLFILPTMIFIIIFGLIPILQSVGYSLTDWDGISTKNFIGLRNYIYALTEDKVFIKALGNTFILTISCLIINLFIGFIGANFLFKLRGLVSEIGKVVLFIPYILSFAAVGLLFSFVFSPTDMGLLNKMLSFFLNEPHSWLGSKLTAMPAIILAHSWKDFGLALLLYYASLQSIPKSYFEAADIDGASEFQKTMKIKIPYVKPITQTLAVLGLVRLMLTFTMIMFLTPEGGPDKATEVVATWFYKQTFDFLEFGYGTTLAIILAIVVGIFTIILRKIIRIDEEMM